MSRSFNDRLSRIARSREDDIRADITGAPEARPISLSDLIQRLDLASGNGMLMMHSVLLGILWMFPTGWILGRYDTLHMLLSMRMESSQDVTQTADAIWMMALVSVVMFMCYFRMIHHLGRSFNAGIGHKTIYCSGLISGIVGYGPINFMAQLAKDIAEKFAT